ncbi:MAG: (E)-4-hydroxy-3-methylbut-2-enyl-diphosphate synthase, partial [Rikenellaceae bacterium]
VRFTAASVGEANSICHIKQELVKQGYTNPLIADVHFNPKAAMVAAQFADKVRINPGNFIDPRAKFETLEYTDKEYKEELARLENEFISFLDICTQHNTAIRIGVNHGSLSDRIMSRYGDSVDGMCESAMEFLRICKEQNFTNVVVSMKSSNVTVMVEAYRAIATKMSSENMCYPLHLGVTEAGEGEDGRIKSALGIGTLLSEGIGDTIRVSLTEPSWCEIEVARCIIEHKEQSYIGSEPHPTKSRTTTPLVVSNIENGECEVSADLKEISGTEINDIEELNASIKSDSIIIFEPTGANTALELVHFFRRYEELSLSNKVAIKKDYNHTNALALSVEMAMDLGRSLLSGYCDYLIISNKSEKIEQNKLISVIFALLQASRARISRTEFISCPGCGRTLFALADVVKEVKERCSKFKGLKIAIMGCIVNGPGEMADADYGYVGAGRGKVVLYKGKEVAVKGIDQSEAVAKLVELIEASER